MSGLGAALAAIIPSIGVGVLFWFAMRAIINADRTERLALARMDAEEAAHARGEQVAEPTENVRPD